MSYYEKKYLKYKNKYIKLKNQIGGIFTLNLKEWVLIENSGQQNCGIFISSVYPTLILKCGTNSYIISMANEINQIMQLFPKIIDNTYIDPNNYTTMQKLDGDITSIFFNLFPHQNHPNLAILLNFCLCFSSISSIMTLNSPVNY
jgi:hypothetical protein